MVNGPFVPISAGRMKTIKQKQVIFDQKAFHDDLEAASTAGTLLGVGGSTVPPFFSVVLALFPFAMTPFSYLLRRDVSYKDVQVPMTPEEEIAVMTPLEKAHFQIQQALDNWSRVRQKEAATVQNLKQEVEGYEQDLKALEAEACPDNVDFTEFQSRLKMRIKAREGSVQDQKVLLETAQKMFVALEAEIQKREQNLFEALEKLNIMQRQKSVIALHKQLEKIKGDSAQGTTAPEIAESHQLMLEMKKQQIEIEAIMASIQTEMDVEHVLNSVSETKC